MEKAFAHHQAGRLKEAEEYYRQVLRLEPTEADANNLLGVLLFQTQRAEEGLGYLATATKIKPTEAMFFYNYAVALRASGQLDNAIQAFSQCVNLDQNHADAMSALVDLLFKRKKHELAIGVLQRLVSLKPMEPTEFRRLGEAYLGAKNHAEAVKAFQRACDLAPGDAVVRHQLGLALQALEDKEGAISAYRKCIELQPDLAAAHNNLAILLADKDETAAAIEHYELAVKHNPNLFQTRCNLGGILRKIGELDRSIECLEEAVKQRSDCAEAWCNLGNSLGDAGQAERAMECYRKALLCKPDYPQARLNRSLGLLRRENFQEGWVEYEWRSKLAECPRRHTSRPRWDGLIESGKKLLVHVEQGLGDTFQMIRYAKLLQEAGMHIILECQKPLCKFLSVNDVAAEIFALGDKLPDFDLQIPLMSLPSLLWEPHGFAAVDSGYLAATPELTEVWRERLGKETRKQIGIAWQGNPAFKQDQFRSVPLAVFQPLLERTDIQYYSLQKTHGTEQLKDLALSDQVRVFDELDEQHGAFMDTAALMKQLDLVVTSDSAVAHLAGALGVKTILMLPYAADWRWLSSRSDCPWYPNMSLYRQESRNDWAGVMTRVVAEVEKLSP